MKRTMMVLLCVVLMLVVPVESFGLTAQQKEVQDAGISVNWLEFDIAYQAAFIQEECEEEGLLLIRLLIDEEQDISKYGFIDRKGQIVIPFDYDKAEGFQDGIAYVKKEGRNYFMDASQNIVIDTSAYDDADEIYLGQIKVYKEGQGYGKIDTQGNVVIPCQYSSITTDSSGMMYVSNSSEKYALFDKSGSQITEFIFDDFYGGAEGFYCFYKNDKFGFLNSSGKEVIPAVYDDAHVFRNGLAAVRQNEKWGFIDTEGNLVIGMDFDYADSFEENGLVYVGKGGIFFYLDREGKEVEPDFSASVYYDESGFGYTSDTVKGFYTRDTVKDDDGGMRFGQDHYTLKEGLYTHTAIDRDGNTVVGPKEYYLDYKGEGIFMGTHNVFEGTGIAPPHNDHLVYALLDENGNRYTSFRNYYYGDFQNGLAVTYAPRPTYFQGVVNRYGTVVLPQIFSGVYLDDNGQCLVELSGYDEDGPYGSIGTLQLPEDAAVRGNPESRVIPVYLNGIELYFDQEPVVLQERTLVPMRKIFEVLGATVEWEESSQTVEAFKDDIHVQLKIDSETAFLNGEPLTLDVPAVIQSERTLVPLRVVAEALGAEVDWDDSRFGVVITVKE